MGLLGFTVDFGIAAALINGLNIHTPTANALSAECAIIFNFSMNNFWSFKHKQIAPGVFTYLRKLIKFNIVSSGSVVIQWSGLTVLIALFGEQSHKIFGTISLGSWVFYKIFLIACIIIPYSYFMYNRFIWKKS
ncbi:MAG: GtrA-like protein [Microgenomates bacterium OLB23]|nr:MAG: GtrA-like protein [Microgenomates bacterium OLB23]